MTELVVLCDDAGNPTGTAPKATVHTSDTPLHLAFSCWFFRGDDVLLTRRALTKKTWPGVWTNTFCGHPGPGEATVDAVHRRAAFELGAQLSDVALALPDFRYRAVDSSGVVENEICPVYTAWIAGTIDPNPEEIDSFAWVPLDDVRRAVAATPFAFSPWMVEELALL